MKKILFFLSFSIILFSSYAQIDKEKALAPKTEQKLADLLYAQGHYYTAIEHYKEVVREKPSWRYPRYWLAMSYYKARDYKNAELWFKKFVNHRLGEKEKVKKIEKENKLIYNKARYYYGQSLKHNAKYSEAIKQFKAFKSEFVAEEKKIKDKEDINWNAKANIEIKGAELGIELAKKSKKVKVANLGEKINTKYEEASPISVSEDELYYSSLNRNELIFIDKPKDIPPYRIFQSKKINGVWQKGKEMPTTINDAELATGNVALSEDGKRMYFTKCYHNEVDEIICAIHFSEKKGDSWSEAQILNKEINDPNFTSTQPAVRSSGDKWDIVYFVSDRDGGKGGMDIWYFIRTAKGNYKGPRLLKGPINTQFDELTPSYSSEDSTFYFSSNGHPSIGGMDVFKTTENDEMQWIEPQNMGAPINSPNDDIYYKRTAGKTSGFLVSDRDGTSLIQERYRGDDLYSFRDFVYGLEGFVVKNNESGKTFVDNAKVKLYATNLEGKEVLIKEIDVNDGEYFFDLKPDQDYKIEVLKPGFSSIFEYVTTKDLINEDTLSKDLSVEKMNIVATGSLYDDSDSTKTTKLDGALVTLIEILPDGTEKSLRAIKMSSKTPDYFFDLDLLKNYTIKVTKDGYFAETLKVDLKNIKEDQDTVIVNSIISKIEVGKSYSLDNVLYDFGKANLTKASELIIDGLAKIMQENPLIIVELSAHTDAIGSDVSNLKLSQARAQSCVDYLINKGLSDSRLIAKGYGESKPIAPNKNEDGSDNEEGRAKNRRTEFKIIGGL